MQLSLNPAFFCSDSAENGYEPLFNTFSRLVKNGFSQFDFLPDVRRDDHIEHALKCREALDKAGAVAHQGHCPIWRYRKITEPDIILKTSLKAVEAAEITGCKYLVVHADEYRFEDGEEYDAGKILPAMYEYVSRIVDKANQKGIKICIENLFEEGRYPGMERSRFTSTVEELLSLVEKFDGEVGVCWDFGHALCAFRENTNEAFMKALPYIRCTHVHDNNMSSDWHALPFSGKNDWKTLIGALKASGYDGNLSYELHCGKIPDDFLDEYLAYCFKLGNYLISL